MQKQALSFFNSRSWSSKVKKKALYQQVGLKPGAWSHSDRCVHTAHFTKWAWTLRKSQVFWTTCAVQQNILLTIFHLLKLLNIYSDLSCCITHSQGLTCNCTDPLPARLCSEARSEGAVQHRDSRGGQTAVWEWTLPSEGPERHQLLLPSTCCQVLWVHVFVFCSKYLQENVWYTCVSQHWFMGSQHPFWCQWARACCGKEGRRLLLLMLYLLASVCVCVWYRLFVSPWSSKGMSIL